MDAPRSAAAGPLTAPPPGSEASRLYDHLTARGVAFRVENGRVRWRSPQGAMRLSDVVEIKRHAAEIAALVTGADGGPGTEAP